MADPYPTGDNVTLVVPPEFAADFMVNNMHKTPARRPVVRMVIRSGDDEVDAGSWQVMAADTVRRDGGYDVSTVTMRRVFDE